MTRQYTRSEMVTWLRAFFQKQGYDVEDYPEVGGVRVPLHCKRQRNDTDGRSDEIAVDVTTSPTVSADEFFPTIKMHRVEIVSASATRFYQHYFPYAKVFLAIPDYALVDEDMKSACKRYRIGLLKVSEQKVEIEGDPSSLIDQLRDNVSKTIESCLEGEEARRELFGAIAQAIDSFVETYLHYLVYYPAPEYKRRQITERTDEANISLLLVDTVKELSSLAYRQQLAELGGYRTMAGDDYSIALETVRSLWKDRIGIDYPEIQREFEPILLLDGRYRDHFLHQFQVFLLGSYIIDRLYPTEQVISRFGGICDCCRIEDAWLVAATLHDFCYCIQEFDSWTKTFFHRTLRLAKNPTSLQLQESFVEDSFVSKSKQLCMAMEHQMTDETLLFLYELVISKKNHGLLSALSLLKLFSDNERSALCEASVVQAALAVAFHDEELWGQVSGCMQGGESHPNTFTKRWMVRNVEFERYPLTFLLIFLDNVQEWGRVGRRYEESKAQLDSISVDANEILVSISVEKDKDFSKKRAEIERVKKFLKDPRFQISLRSRVGGLRITIPMQGQ